MDVGTLVVIVKKDEKLIVGDADITIKYESGEDARVRVSIKAPKSVKIKKIKKQEVFP